MKTPPRGKTQPKHWALNIRGPHMIEALCAHGIGHHKGTHGCDGCCGTPPPADIWDQVTIDRD